MDLESVNRYARERYISIQEASQVLMQVLVLKHLSDPKAHFIGDTALVFGYGNPRFSEDVDLTQVKSPKGLQSGLVSACREIEDWFGKPVTLVSPKVSRRTWRLVCRMGPSAAIQLHVDTQPYRAITSQPLVIQYPSLSPCICQMVGLQEIMAEKIIAVAWRRHLGGRDLFDLWFHWLRRDDWEDQCAVISRLIRPKLKERGLHLGDLQQRLTGRLKRSLALDRAREEWRRYLPADFQKKAIQDDIVGKSRRLIAIILT